MSKTDDDANDFVEAIIRTQGDTISGRISNVTGSLPGSDVFFNAKMAITKFLKIFPGQEEISSLTETFQMMSGAGKDKFFHGSLTSRKLINAMHMKGIDFSDAELRLVFPILDLDGDGTIDLDEFTHFGMAATITAQRISSGIGTIPGSDQYEKGKIAVEKVLRLVPQHVLTYYSGRGELEALKLWLESVDADGNGSIDPDELKAAMKRFDVDMHDSEIDLIFPILDVNNDGNFDLEELNLFVRAATRTNTLQQQIVQATGANPGTDKYKRAKTAVDKLLNTVPGRRELQTLREVFELIAPGSDKVKKEALQNCLHRFECPFSDEEADLCFRVLDLDGDGAVDMTEFADFVKACSTTTQRIQEGCGHMAGTLEFEQAMLAVNKILSIVPGRDEMSALVDTFRKIDKDQTGHWSEDELKNSLHLPQFQQRIKDAGLRAMTDEEVGLVFMVLDQDNHGAINLDTFIEFFKQARTLGMTLAYDDSTLAADSPANASSTSRNGLTQSNSVSAMKSSFKQDKRSVDLTRMNPIDAVKQEKEMNLSKVLGRVHNNDHDLQVLCMAGMGLKDAHVKSLCFSFQHNTHVRSIHLQYNDITDEGAQMLADVILEKHKQNPKNCNLQSINLAANLLTSRGIEALQQCVETTSISQLRFKGCPGFTESCLQRNGAIIMDSI